MGWKNSFPLFCAITKTIADITNAALCQTYNTAPPHVLDTAVSQFDALTHDSQLDTPTMPQDPSLLLQANPIKYVVVIVDDFVGVAQNPHLSHIHYSLL